MVRLIPVSRVIARREMPSAIICRAWARFSGVKLVHTLKLSFLCLSVKHKMTDCDFAPFRYIRGMAIEIKEQFQTPGQFIGALLAERNWTQRATLAIVLHVGELGR